MELTAKETIFLALASARSELRTQKSQTWNATENARIQRTLDKIEAAIKALDFLQDAELPVEEEPVAE